MGSQSIASFQRGVKEPLTAHGLIDTTEMYLRTVFQLEEEGIVPMPDFWGGYRLAPEVFEFWQGRVNRLHDRLRYRRDGARWVIERLAP